VSELLLERLETGLVRRGADVDDDVAGPIFRLESADDFPDASTDPIPTDGRSRLPGHRDPDPRQRLAVRDDEELEEGAGPAPPFTVGALEIGSPPEATISVDQTARRLRPFRRRAARTARPLLVAMRTRKPCLRFRRRLFGL
jgi:hypothetical protein